MRGIPPVFEKTHSLNDSLKATTLFRPVFLASYRALSADLINFSWLSILWPVSATPKLIVTTTEILWKLFSVSDMLFLIRSAIITAPLMSVSGSMQQNSSPPNRARQSSSLFWFGITILLFGVVFYRVDGVHKGDKRVSIWDAIFFSATNIASGTKTLSGFVSTPSDFKAAGRFQYLIVLEKFLGMLLFALFLTALARTVIR